MNVKLFRDALAEHGLWTAEGDHPAVAVLIRHAVAAQRLTDFLYRKGVFAIGFCHPVVPEGAARIRAQVTVRHSQKALSQGGRRVRRRRHRAQDRPHLRQQVAD